MIEEERQQNIRADEIIDAFTEALLVHCPMLEGPGGLEPFDAIIREAQRVMNGKTGYTPIQYTGYRKKKLSPGLRKRILERDAYRCRYCGSHLDLHVHHVVPEVKGGPSTDENLVAACRNCNLTIGTKFVPPAGWVLPAGVEVPA